MSMHAEKISVGKKQVWPRKAYIPDSDSLIEFVGREEELRMIGAAWISGARSQPLAPLLVGPPGCGKNRLVFEMAKRMNQDLYVCQGYENITAEELACTLMPSDEGNGRIDYLISTLATAMLKGGICFIDEIGKFPGKALALLASVLDDRRYIDLDLIGERIVAHPRFRFIAATNSEDIVVLPDFVRSRLFPVIRVEKPATEMINSIIQRQFPSQQQNMETLLTLFWRLWDSAYEKQEMPSPRDVIQIFSLADKLADFETASAAISGRVQAKIGHQHLERALQQFCEAGDAVSC